MSSSTTAVYEEYPRPLVTVRARELDAIGLLVDTVAHVGGVVADVRLFDDADTVFEFHRFTAAPVRKLRRAHDGCEPAIPEVHR
jgi:hypothetical protein